MTHREHVLVVDDEPRYRRLIQFNLESTGYRVTCAGTGEEAVALAGSEEPDLVLLDVMLPGIDGFDVCRRIRERSPMPIIMLTAKGADDDKVRGLRLGADDYVTKPFSVEVLLARVEAVLRRARPSPAEAGPGALKVGDLEVDVRAQRVTVGGREARLSPTEFRLLACLAASPGTVLSRNHLLETVWGPSYLGEHEILRIALWRLRHKLADDAAGSGYIVTRPGFGYMLEAPDARGSAAGGL